MPVVIKAKIYAWLQKIGVFHKDPIKTKDADYFEVPFDEQIYLQNGYLIGVTVRKFVKVYSQEYEELLKVRKIATLKSSQNENWRIIQPFLIKFGCDAITPYTQEDSQTIQISPSKIAQILESLYDQFSPKEQQKSKLAKRSRLNHVDIYNFNADKPASQAQNSLQLICIILVKTFHTNLREALGLLMNKSKYLRRIIVEGSKVDQFDSVSAFYEQLTNYWQILEELTIGCGSDLQKILQTISEGVLSSNMDILLLTLNVLSNAKEEDWFIKSGYYKILSSNHIQCFNFTIQRLNPNYQIILNTKLHTFVPNKTQLIAILTNIIKSLPKTIFSKQVFACMPLSYFYEQCYTVLNVDDIDDQPHHLIVISLELLAKLIAIYPDKIPHSYLSKIMETFRFMPNRSHSDTYHMLALLFDIIESLISKQSFFTEKFFKLCMKYCNSTFGETRHWIIHNLKYLYSKMSKSFPLGCFLAMYTLDPIGQADQYQLFDLIAEDNNKISQQQCTKALTYITKYIQDQLHCKCFMDILKKFLKNQNKSASQWGEYLCINQINRMNQINIPMFNEGQINILNPRPPVKNRVNSIGIKRKEMMKFAEYQLGKRLLYALLEIKDKNFFNFYLASINHAILVLEKQIGHKKKQLLNLYKTLRNLIKKQFMQIHEPESVDELVKSIAINKSIVSKTAPLQHVQNQTSPLSQSKFIQSQSLIYSAFNKGQIIEQDQQQQNEFMQNINTGREQIIQQQQQVEIVREFTQKQKQQDETSEFIYTKEVLEQNQIEYVNATKQKYSYLLTHCVQAYQKYENKQIINKYNRVTNSKDNLIQLISQLGVTNLIEVIKFQRILKQLKIQYSNVTPNEFVSALLLQVGFFVFEFKKNRRVSITCMSSLLALIDEKLKQDNQQYKSKATAKNKIDHYLITKNILYDHKLSKKVLEENKGNKYMECFAILSEVLEKGLGICLLQPISKQVNTFNQKDQKKERKQQRGIKTIRQEQLSMLEQQLERQARQQEKEVSVDPKPKGTKNKVKLRLNSYTSNVNKEKQKQEKKEKQDKGKKEHSSTPHLVDNKELKSKIAKRIKILSDELNKNEKKININVPSNQNKEEKQKEKEKEKEKEKQLEKQIEKQKQVEQESKKEAQIEANGE